MSSVPFRVIYGFDPLCGWCYVFGPVLRGLLTHFGETMQVRLAMGGLVVGARVKPMSAVREYLRGAMPEAERRSGVRFGDAFVKGLLLDDEYTMASEPACRAVIVAAELALDGGLGFGLTLCEAIYRDGLRPDDAATLRTVARSQGLDAEVLIRRWDSDAARRATADAFASARAEGISMYPTLRIDAGPTGGPDVELLRGFAPLPEVIERFERALAARAITSPVTGS
jgi:putative protein-disulfide isomerase